MFLFSSVELTTTNPVVSVAFPCSGGGRTGVVAEKLAGKATTFSLVLI
jgi:hypothetical protein